MRNCRTGILGLAICAGSILAAGAANADVRTQTGGQVDLTAVNAEKTAATKVGQNTVYPAMRIEGETLYVDFGDATEFSPFLVDPMRMINRQLSPNCQPAGNCQSEGGTTANNMSAFRTADDFVPTGTTISSVCFQGIYLTVANFPICFPAGDTFNINFFPDTPGQAFPDESAPNASFRTTGIGGTAVTNKVTTGATFAGREVVQWTITLGTPVTVTAGDCWWLEIKHEPTPGCSVFWEQSPQGNGQFIQTPAANPFAPGQNGTGDMAVCFGTGINIVAADNCLFFCGFPPLNDECLDAENDPTFALSIPDSVVSDTVCGSVVDFAPAPPEYGEGILPTTQPGVWYTLTPATSDPIELTLSSATAEPALVVYCGGCEFLWPITGAGEPDNATQGFTSVSVTFTPNAGTEYLILVTSDLNSATDLTLDVVLAGSGPDPIVCGPCDLINQDLYDNANIIEATGVGTTAEPCDDTGNTRVNEGCSLTPAAFIQAGDGDVIAGTTWSTDTSRDIDWIEVDVPSAPAVVQVVLEGRRAMFLNRLWNDGLDYAGNVIDCGAPIFRYLAESRISQPCAPVSVSIAVANPGKYYFQMGPAQFGGQPCGVANEYVAAVLVSSCTITPPSGAVLENEACGVTTVNPGCSGVAVGGTPGPSTAISVGQTGSGEIFANAGTRDLDSWQFVATATDLDIIVEAEFPWLMIVQDLTPGCFAGDGFTTTGFPCSPTTVSATGFVVGNTYEVILTIAEFDGEGIFSQNFSCLTGLTAYNLTISDGAVAEPCEEFDITDSSLAPNSPDGQINAFDLSLYINLWLAGDPAADLTDASLQPNSPDGLVNAFDLSYYVNGWLAFQGACP